MTSIDQSNDAVFSLIGAVNITVKILPTRLSLQYLMQSGVFSVCVRGCISITKTPAALRISAFDSLTLLVCFKWSISILNIITKNTLLCLFIT